MDFLTLLTGVAQAYDQLAKGGAKAEADKLLLGITTFLAALEAVKAA